MNILLTNDTLGFMIWLKDVKNIDLEQFAQTYDKYAVIQETPIWKEYKEYLRKNDLNKDFD